MLPPPAPNPNAVPTEPHRYFVADVHLDGGDPPFALSFRQFLKRLGDEARTRPVELFILGDLFVFWCEYHAPLFEIYRRDLEALESAGQAGVKIYLFSGNRDFSYGRYVQRRLGAAVLGDGGQITLSGSRPAWLEHGDLLCTADRAYLRFRKIVRSWPVRLFFRLLPWSAARGLIERVRRKSERSKAAKRPAVFDIDLEAARKRLEEKRCRVLLCGHTHCPQACDLGAGYRLLVLPAWCEAPGGYHDDGRSLQSFEY